MHFAIHDNSVLLQDLTAQNMLSRFLFMLLFPTIFREGGCDCVGERAYACRVEGCNATLIVVGWVQRRDAV